jgi:hypothetical protein
MKMMSRERKENVVFLLKRKPDCHLAMQVRRASWCGQSKYPICRSLTPPLNDAVTRHSESRYAGLNSDGFFDEMEE